MASAPTLDARDYAGLLEEVLARIPVYAPDWTDVNRSDAGLTLIELFTFLGEELLAYLEDDRRRRRRRRALILAGVAGAALLLWWETRRGNA